MSYDRRDYMAYRKPSQTEVIEVTRYDDDGEEYVTHLPTKFEVCGTCSGKGSHVNPSIDSNGITESEMHELGPDFEEEYFGGMYDQTCNECEGERVTPVVDVDSCNQDQLNALQEMQEDEQDRRDDYITMQRECGYM